jgi:hypothetical protein
MNGMDAIEHDAAGMSRQVLLAGSLRAITAAAGAARAVDASIGFSALHHGANDPLPPAASGPEATSFKSGLVVAQDLLAMSLFVQACEVGSS